MTLSQTLRTRWTALPAPVRGAVWMVVAAAMLTSMAAAVKVLSKSGMHTFEIVFFRMGLVIPFMLPWMIRTNFSGLRTSKLGLLAVRGVLTFVAANSFFWGLKLVPLADATVMLFTRPLFGTLLAMVALHEAVRARRWTAMAIGFAGVLIMVRPGFEELNPGLLLILVSAIVSAGIANMVRYLSRTESPDTITIYYAIFLALFTVGPAIYVWQTPTAEQIWWILGLGFFGTLGQRAMSRAFAAADISVVLPVDFSRLIFAAAIGFALFDEEPEIWTWIGGIVIFASTFYIARREAQLARRETAG